jgi:hypothetical protein
VVVVEGMIIFILPLQKRQAAIIKHEANMKIPSAKISATTALNFNPPVHIWPVPTCESTPDQDLPAKQDLIQSSRGQCTIDH